MDIKSIGVIFATSAMLSFCAWGQSPSAYNKAVTLYKAEKYDSTIVFIRNYLKKNGKNEDALRLVPLIVESMVRKGELESTHRLFEMYRQKYGTSPYMPRMHYLEGVVEAREGHYPAAIQLFSDALARGVSKSLDSMILVNTEKICDHGLTEQEISSIASGSDIDVHLREIAAFYDIVKLSASAEVITARSLAEEFRRTYPHSYYEPRVRELMERVKSEQKDLVQIGLLAPLSGDDADIGRKVVQGAQLAIENHNAARSPKVSAIILDTKGDAVETARRSSELLIDHPVPILIGPVLSQEAAVSAAMALGKNTVMLTPTATDDGIAELGDNIFQMNNTLGVLGRRIARYAVENLNIHEFAIIAPKTPYGQALANSFKEELKRKNAQVVAEESFDEGTNDFSAQFKSLRTALLMRKLEGVSFDKEIDAKQLAHISHADSLKYADSTLMVGGLFLPAEAEDAIMLAPEVAFNRIKTQLLGATGWNSPKVLSDGKGYATDAIISTSFEPEASRREWIDFKTSYAAHFNSEPDRIAALGYDAAMLVLKALEEDGWNQDADKISRGLLTIQGYRGLSGMISFDHSRANTEAAIMKITNNGFVRVQ